MMGAELLPSKRLAELDAETMASLHQSPERMMQAKPLHVAASGLASAKYPVLA